MVRMRAWAARGSFRAHLVISAAATITFRDFIRSMFVTLVISMKTDNCIVQVSDRRLTRASKVVSDEVDKAASFTIPAGRYIFGFAGLAGAGDFFTADWVNRAVLYNLL